VMRPLPSVPSSRFALQAMRSSANIETFTDLLKTSAHPHFRALRGSTSRKLHSQRGFPYIPADRRTTAPGSARGPHLLL
jgi:hypothetical protein